MEEKSNVETQLSAGTAIYKSIAGVISDIGAVGKDKVNKQQGYKFRSVDDVYNALHPALAKNKVFIVPRILEQTRECVGMTKNGAKMTLVICRISFTFYAEDGSNVECVVIGEGMDTGDKATNKAMAVAYKYACFQVFCIPTEEMTDPDAETPELDIETPQEKTKTDQKKRSKKSAEPPKENRIQKEAVPELTAQDTPERITEAMLNTIRAEQKRTGVTDKQILSMKSVKAKEIPDLTVQEFNFVMKKFKVTGDLPKGGENE